MTVKELIQQLQKCDPETLILVDGYESGFSDISKIREIKVELNVHTEEYNGPHEETDKSNTKAYLLGRLPNPNSKWKDES